MTKEEEQRAFIIFYGEKREHITVKIKKNWDT